MAAAQLTSAASSISSKGFVSFEGLRASKAVNVSSFSPLKQNALSLRSFPGLVVKAATTVAPKVYFVTCNFQVSLLNSSIILICSVISLLSIQVDN